MELLQKSGKLLMSNMDHFRKIIGNDVSNRIMEIL